MFTDVLVTERQSPMSLHVSHSNLYNIEAQNISIDPCHRFLILEHHHQTKHEPCDEEPRRNARPRIRAKRTQRKESRGGERNLNDATLRISDDQRTEPLTESRSCSERLGTFLHSHFPWQSGAGPPRSFVSLRRYAS